jgi:hypothetical protein
MWKAIDAQTRYGTLFGIMKNTFEAGCLLLWTFILTLSSPVFAGTGWDDDYDKALAKAKTENKMVSS